MTGTEGLDLAKLLATEVGIPLIKAILAASTDKVKTTQDLHDIIDATAANAAQLEGAEKADDALAENAIDDKFPKGG